MLKLLTLLVSLSLSSAAFAFDLPGAPGAIYPTAILPWPGVTAPPIDPSFTVSGVSLGTIVANFTAILSAAPTVSSCGTSPSIDSGASNRSGTVTVGSGTVSSCTVTFVSSGFTNVVHCRITPQTASLAVFGYSYTKTAVTVTATSLTGAKFDYDCNGT